jgi:hypothetical protein
MSTFQAMNSWAAILMSGVASIWAAMLSAVAYRVRVRAGAQSS